MRPRISYDKKQRLPIVALVKKATFFTGKFETKAQILAMRQLCWLLASQLLSLGKSIKKINALKKLSKSPLESQRVNKSIFLKNYFAAS